ncbi:MAG: rRNA pseudouridine synthase [Cytophagales bacterium]|nr:rRNA pseudouridine synthase [Cytophagales bacterium]
MKKRNKNYQKNIKRGAKKSNTKSTQAPRYDFSKLPTELQPNNQQEAVRLNKFIANAGVCSRREADQLIADGLVTVNGKKVTEMGMKVSAKDDVRYNGKRLNPEKLVYVLLNKPKDHITTMDDPFERKTVMNLVKTACTERIFPVGRLDRNTTGLLILTNDGDMSERLSHPSNNIKKVYEVLLDKPLTQEDYETIGEGFELEDGEIKVDAIAVAENDARVVGLEIHSGKNRIVRRIFEHFKYDVVKLDRTYYAGITKKNLPRGKWRFLTEKEVIRLKGIGNSRKQRSLNKK